MINFDQHLSLALDETQAMLDVLKTDSIFKTMLLFRRDNLINQIEVQEPELVDRPRCTYEVWNMIRKAVLRRDRFQCQGCGRTGGLDLHHIVPVSRGGEDDPMNLISLCRECHTAIHPWLDAK
jgi:predicted restriction endonuclease